jgi:hypothetical protein
MPRATDEDVRAYVVISTSVSTAPYINSAVVVVESLLEGKGLSESVLTQIEIFLAAHFAVLAVERGGIRREAMGESSQSFQTISENFKGFTLTRFGQSALALDTTGTLAEQGNANLKAKFRVVGDASPKIAS